jgi:hypothetical protein
VFPVILYDKVCDGCTIVIFQFVNKELIQNHNLIIGLVSLYKSILILFKYSPALGEANPTFYQEDKLS